MNDAKQASPAFGGFLILPLKYDPDRLGRARLEALGEPAPVTTADVNENIKAMFDPASPASVGWGRVLPRQALWASLGGGRAGALKVRSGGREFDFSLEEARLYVFNTRVAFLCLALTFPSMETLAAICNPGWASSSAAFFRLDEAGQSRAFSLEGWLDGLLGPLGLQKFFDGPSSYLLDAYVYTFTLAPEWFDTLEEMRAITFNLHKMVEPDAPMEDAAEEDIRYVFAARNRDKNAYRWGCCVASQTISYVVADPALDLAAQLAVQAEDGLPVVLLALYEKYTCLRFTELMARLKKGRMKELRELKNLLLNFRAFGTAAPANLSRWHNVKQIFANLLAVNDVEAAVADVSAKLDILAAHQQELEHARSETVINLITLFGIVSILASVLSIVQILSDGNTLIWASTILTTGLLTLATAFALRRR